jgi:hypothetical protein
MQDLSFNGSFLGDITDNVITHNGANFFRYGKNEFRYVKIHVEKIGTTHYTFDAKGVKVSMAVWTDLMADVLKGIFYLPSFGFHTGIIKSVSVSEDTEIVTKSRYCIRPVYDEVLTLERYLKKYGPEGLTESDNDLINRLKIFAHILKIKEPIIELRKLSISEKSFWIPTCRCREIGGTKDGSAVFPDGDGVQTFIKPFRTPLILKYRMEKILLTYFPDRKNEIESWMNEVLMSLEPPGPEMNLRSLPDFSGLPVLPDKEMKLSIERPQVHPDIAKEPVEKVREPMKGREFSLGSRNLMKNLPPIPEV